MISEYTRERLDGWIGDFCAGDELDDFPANVAEQAHGLLLTWLVAACEHGDVEPEDLAQDDLRHALLQTLARLDVTDEMHAHVPTLCSALLSDLEHAGRLADGHAWGLYVTALQPAYIRAVRGEVTQLARPGTKLGRNDPCPCGSGKKYKKCCMGA